MGVPDHIPVGGAGNYVTVGRRLPVVVSLGQEQVRSLHLSPVVVVAGVPDEFVLPVVGGLLWRGEVGSNPTQMPTRLQFGWPGFLNAGVASSDSVLGEADEWLCESSSGLVQLGGVVGADLLVSFSSDPGEVVGTAVVFCEYVVLG